MFHSVYNQVRTRQLQSQMFIFPSDTCTIKAAWSLLCGLWSCYSHASSGQYCLPLIWLFMALIINRTCSVLGPFLKLCQHPSYHFLMNIFVSLCEPLCLICIMKAATWSTATNRLNYTFHPALILLFSIVVHATGSPAILSAVVDEYDERLVWRLLAYVIQCWLLFCWRIWWNSSCYYCCWFPSESVLAPLSGIAFWCICLASACWKLKFFVQAVLQKYTFICFVF